MDTREFTVIENEKLKNERKEIKRVTNPIAKKFIKFHENKNFNVKDLFKN